MWRCLVIVLLLCGHAACRHPCVDLAKAICRCEPSKSLQDACIQRIDSERGSKGIDAADDQRCADTVDTCKPLCDKLKEGALEQCGLAHPTQAE